MIGFAGLSHLGLVSSIAAASKGQSVVAFDPDAALCRELQKTSLPVSEPGLPELLKENASHIEFTDDPARLSHCELLWSLDPAPRLRLRSNRILMAARLTARGYILYKPDRAEVSPSPTSWNHNHDSSFIA